MINRDELIWKKPAGSFYFFNLENKFMINKYNHDTIKIIKCSSRN